MEKVYINGRMATLMMESGQIMIYMEKVCFIGQIGENMLDNLSKTKDKEKECICGQTGGNMMATGNKVNNTEQGNTLTQMEKCELEDGKWAKNKNGQIKIKISPKF